MQASAMVQVQNSYREFVPARPRPALRDVSQAIAPAPAPRTACRPKDLSLLEGLDTETTRQVEELATARIRLKSGQTLFRTGDRFSSLYWIRSGSFKTVTLLEDGCDQVGGYHMMGCLLYTSPSPRD